MAILNLHYWNEKVGTSGWAICMFGSFSMWTARHLTKIIVWIVKLWASVVALFHLGWLPPWTWDSPVQLADVVYLAKLPNGSLPSMWLTKLWITRSFNGVWVNDTRGSHWFLVKNSQKLSTHSTHFLSWAGRAGRPVAVQVSECVFSIPRPSKRVAHQIAVALVSLGPHIFIIPSLHPKRRTPQAERKGPVRLVDLTAKGLEFQVYFYF